MRIPIRLLIALAGLCAAAGSTQAETSIWKVSKGGSELFLAGTVHVLRASDLPLPHEFDAAYAASSKVLLEADVSQLQTPQVQQTIMTQGMYLDGTTLETAISPEAWKAAEEYCAKAGLPVDQLKSFKPWFFALMITSVELQKLGVSAEGADMLFAKKAAKDGKALAYLENFDDHIDYLVRMGEGKESELILNSVKDLSELPTMVDNLLLAWKKGDVAKVDEIMLKDLRAKFPALFEELLVKRNKLWLPKIEALIKTPEVELILVGVGHLAGEQGLLTLLKKRGYEVTQFSASK